MLKMNGVKSIIIYNIRRICARGRAHGKRTRCQKAWQADRKKKWARHALKLGLSLMS